MNLPEAVRFVRANAKRIAADPESATTDEVRNLAAAAARIEEGYQAELDALVLAADHDMRPW